MPRSFMMALGGLALGLQAATAAPRPPTVQVTTPTTQATYTTTASSLTVAGTARASGGGVRQVTWQTAQGASGVAQGTTAWSLLLPLALGETRLTVTVTDRAGRRGTDVLTITRVDVPPPPPPPPAPPLLAWNYAGTDGDAFQMERCAGSVGCPMAPVAAIGISERQWTDISAVLGAPYCWRLAATLGGLVGPYSNTACTP